MYIHVYTHAHARTHTHMHTYPGTRESAQQNIIVVAGIRAATSFGDCFDAATCEGFSIKGSGVRG